MNGEGKKLEKRKKKIIAIAIADREWIRWEERERDRRLLKYCTNDWYNAYIEYYRIADRE